MGWDRLSRIGAGVNPSNLHAETVDGANPLAVADAVARKRALLVAGKGPALLDVETYRISGHSTTDANVYRTREEMQAWSPHDPDRRPCRGAPRGRPSRRRLRGGDAGRGEGDDPRRHRRSRQPRGGAADRHRRPADADRRADVLPRSRATSTAPILLLAEAAAASSHLRQLGKKSRAAPRAGRREALADAGDHHPRRAVRGDPPPLPPRPDADRLWRGMPRMGRRLRRLSRPHRHPPLPPPVQFADLGGGDRRHRRSATPSRAAGRWSS